METKLLQQITPLIGGETNIRHYEEKDGDLFVFVRDRGLIDLRMLQKLEGISRTEMIHSCLKVETTKLPLNKEEKTMAIDNKKIAEDILAAVGGKENVTSVTHCATRLRFALKDEAKANENEIRNVKGIAGMMKAGGQHQIIVGQNVPKVYDELCKMGGFAKEEAIDENLDAPKQKLTLKSAFNSMLDYVSASITPMIPLLLVGSMFKTLQAVLGPNLLKLIAPGNEVYTLLNILYNGVFYFMPVYLGFNAAKRLNASQMLGAYCGCMLLVPEFAAMAGTTFPVFGIPAKVYNYGSSVVPVLLSVYVMHFVERFFKKRVPDVIALIFTPFLTMLVMVPIVYCLLAPIGNVLGELIGAALAQFSGTGGFIAFALIAAFWEFFVMTGMHAALGTFIIANFMQLGYDNTIMSAAFIATWATFGMALGTLLRVKDKNEKGMALGCLISGFVGGVTEPALYGIGVKYKKPFIGMVLGGLIGGLYAGITKVTIYMITNSSFMMLLTYVAGGLSNIINGIVASLIALIISTIWTYLFGFSKDDPVLQNKE